MDEMPLSLLLLFYGIRPVLCCGRQNMKEVVITGIEVEDRRFDLENGAGSDAVHTVPVYAYAVCRLKTNGPLDGVGLAFTLGSGNDLVCRAIEYLSESLVGREIHELMSDYGAVFAALTDSPCYRWLGPHKGVVHLALASITNACFDLWAKAEDVPLWKLLIQLRPEQIVSLLDFRYVEDLLTKEEALELLREGWKGREERETVLRTASTEAMIPLWAGSTTRTIWWWRTPSGRWRRGSPP